MTIEADSLVSARRKAAKRFRTVRGNVGVRFAAVIPLEPVKPPPSKPHATLGRKFHGGFALVMAAAAMATPNPRNR